MAEIGSRCCQGIKFPSHQCQPALLTSLGYTTVECDILRDYCDAFSGPAPSPTPLNTEDDSSDWE